MACWLFPKCQGLCGIIFILCFLHLLHLWSRFPHLFHRWGDGSLQRINTFLIVLLLSPQAQLHPRSQIVSLCHMLYYLGEKIAQTPRVTRVISHRPAQVRINAELTTLFQQGKIPVKSLKDQRLPQSNSEHPGHNYEMLPLLPTKS